jgi:catechol 2,3-dioxygenase-like lactoylglutathione lyase family enzyme
MFDHVGLKVQELARSIAFYQATLGALGLEMASSGEDYAGFGPKGEPALWLHLNAGGPGRGAHVALRAPNRAAVERFHALGLAAGGRDNGAPGKRPYHPGYYACFVLDPDGNNVEAVFHGPARRSAAAVSISF